MKYFFDTEFKEGPRDKRFLRIKYGETKPTIDLISIGIVAEDGRDYYAISKDFNLRQAWNDEWIRENVLLPIYLENVHGDHRNKWQFNYSGMKAVIDMAGKSNDRIASDIMMFTLDPDGKGYQKWLGATDEYIKALKESATERPEFYAYYADYDWVVFCQLFGRMIDLPNGFPMYCKDLKQMFDEKGVSKENPNYPKQENEHNALADARWNKELFKFLQ